MATTNNDTSQGGTVFELNNGINIPALGFGAMKKNLFFDPAERDHVRTLIIQALQAGYRLLDTSKLYKTEDLVGEAIKQSGVPRSEITVITKVFGDDYHDVRAAFEKSRKLLDTYVDIYLMHWPMALAPDGSGPRMPDESPTYIEVYQKMEELVGPDCRAIGVSNLTQKTLEPLLKVAKIKPMVNEIEIHPLNPNLKLVPYCLERGIRPIAWGPLAGGVTSHYGDTTSIYEAPVFKSLASRYNLSIGTLILSWLVQRGIVVVPHSSSPTRLADNRRLVTLTDEEVKDINSLHESVGPLQIIKAASGIWMDITGKGNTIMGWTVQEVGWVDDEGRLLT